ncbi:MAG: D-alanyl-D-alanine carboxypeptidase [Lachnospiraceae bacterium]|nr:D-alanyl-D-alanine carboxypeptidase [Lachnospiraceae bacterium]
MKEKRALLWRKRLFCVICLFAVFSGIFTDGIPVQRDSSTRTVKAAGSKWPTLSKQKVKGLSCGSAIVMELSTGTILYQKKMHKKFYPASITKILTAMLTAENTSPNEILTVSETAAYGISEGDSTVYSEPGEKLTIEECLYAIMLQSANELCLAVGEHISGSVKEFVKLMNKRVKELGLKDTHFNNPNGLPDEKHYTSAHDMAVIARTAMKNDLFKKVCGTKSYTCPKTNKHKEERFWPNHHQMMNAYEYPKYAYKYCTGGKTGFTRVSGNTLVTYAEKDGMELVCVVMKSGSPKNGEPNEYTDTTTLLNFGFENYRKHQISRDDTEINDSLFNTYGSYFDSKNSPVHLSGESSVILPKGVKLSKAKQEISYVKKKEIKEGDNIIGGVKYTYKGKTVGFSDIIYTKKTEDESSSLDSASRKMMNKEIGEMEAKRKKDEQNATFWRNIKNTLGTFFGYTAVRIGLAVLVLSLLLFLLIRFGRNFRMPRVRLPRFHFRRRDRSTGGYRNKRARRNYRRRRRTERRNGKSDFGSGRRRRNTRRYYEKKAVKTPKEKKKSSLQHGKKHKNTRESFGKNFFDF